MTGTFYSLREDVFFDYNPEGIYILSPKGETLVLDDDVAKVIWRELTQNTSLSIRNLVDKLLLLFKLEESSRSDVENDVTRFLTELMNYGLVEAKDYELQESFH